MAEFGDVIVPDPTIVGTLDAPSIVKTVPNCEPMPESLFPETTGPPAAAVVQLPKYTLPLASAVV